MSPTPAEAVAATLTPLTTNSKRNNNKNNNKHGADVDCAAAAAAAARLSFAKSVSDANEYTQDLPPPPEVGTSKIGSDILLMTPKQMAEAYEKAMQAKESEESGESETKEKKSAKQGIKFSFNWRSILRIVSELPDKLLQAVGRFLRFILHLDMHGGNTGNNTKFVEGLIDFLAGSIGEWRVV